MTIRITQIWMVAIALAAMTIPADAQIRIGGGGRIGAGIGSGGARVTGGAQAAGGIGGMGGVINGATRTVPGVINGATQTVPGVIHGATQTVPGVIHGATQAAPGIVYGTTGVAGSVLNNTQAAVAVNLPANVQSSLPLGLTVSARSSALRVHAVSDNSLVAQAGLRSGDYIWQVGNTQVRDAAAFRAALHAQLATQTQVPIYYQRGNQLAWSWIRLAARANTSAPLQGTTGDVGVGAAVGGAGAKARIGAKAELSP